MEKKTGLRLIFAGTPAFAAAHLSALLDSEHEVVAVYTQPDRPAGRGKKLTESPVKQLAKSKHLPVLQPQTLKDSSVLEELSQFHADLMIVVAYGLILPQSVLDAPRLGCLNVHGSLLPRWRGAAPIQRAVEAGDKQTGVTIMQMDAGLDTGDILATEAYDIQTDDTSLDVFNKLEKLGADCLITVLDAFAEKRPPQRINQNEKLANYASKISKKEALIDWTESAASIERKIRAFNPFPITYTFLEGERIKVHSAELLSSERLNPELIETLPADKNVTDRPGTIFKTNEQGIDVVCKDSLLRLTRIQLPGKKTSAVKEILLGNKSLFTGGKKFTVQE